MLYFCNKPNIEILYFLSYFDNYNLEWSFNLEDIRENRDNIINKINTVHKNSHFWECNIPDLIAVSKKQDDYKIDAALICGQKKFGENRVQEAAQRWEDRIKHHKDIELRLIGPLQTNKVKQALKLFDIIETLDREKLAKEIFSSLNDQTKTNSFYIQVNTGNESQKNGILPLEANNFINYCKYDLNLSVTGLMCIPPSNEEPAMHFSLLKKIASRNNLKQLSMGMSNDFEEAIKFGATSVRIGSKFFGDRSY